MSRCRSARRGSDPTSARSMNWRHTDQVGDQLPATMAKSYAHVSDDVGRLHRDSGSVCRFGPFCGFCPQCRTLIRHAAPSGAILAAAVSMHLPPAFTRLIAAPSLPLPAASLLQGAITTTVHLATVTSAADTDLLTATATKKQPRIKVVFAARPTRFTLRQHCF